MYVLPNFKTLLGVALCAALVVPAGAQARDGGGRGGERGDARGGVPSRVASRAAKAIRALDRAEERADDGEIAGAVSSLGAVRKNLASALKAAKKQAVAGDDDGPASIGAVTRAQHRVALGSADLLDGAGDELTSAAAATLDAALDGRDEAIAHVAALADHSDYRFDRVARDADGESEAFTEAIADDTLTAGGKAALEAAVAQVATTKTAASALASAAGDDRRRRLPRWQRLPRR